MGSLQSYTTEHLHFHFSLSCIGEGNGNPLQCSCLENPRDGEAWWAAVYGVAQSRKQLRRLSSSSSSPCLTCASGHDLISLSFHFLSSVMKITLFSDSLPEDGEMGGGPTHPAYPGVFLWLSVNKIQLFSALQMQLPSVCLCNKPRTPSGPRYIQRTKRGSETLTSERLKLPTLCQPGPT